MEQFERKRCGSGGVVDGVGGNRRALGQQIGQLVRNRSGWGEKWSGIGAVGVRSGAESEGSGIDEGMIWDTGADSERFGGKVVRNRSSLRDNRCRIGVVSVVTGE